MFKSVKYKEKEKLLKKALLQTKNLGKLENFSGSSPTSFIGQYGYPKLNLGLLSSSHEKENIWEYDAPNYWAMKNTSIDSVVGYRTQLVNSRVKNDVKDVNKFVRIAQEVAMSTKGTNVEVKLKKKPTIGISPSSWVAPLGPQAQLNKIDITSNTKIPTKVERMHNDTDLLCKPAIETLYTKGIDEVKLSRMLSTGAFGKEKNRKLVPTRWSIAATDDILSSKNLDTLKTCESIDEYRTYFGHYLGNYYLIMQAPGVWNYELFELYVKPGKLEYSNDYEGYKQRTTYASNCAGGYYTVRLAITDNLMKCKRQSQNLVIRFITDDYIMPLGVWVTREASRKVMKAKPITFSDEELIKKYAIALAKKKFGINIEEIFVKVKKFCKQKNLAEYY